MDSRQDVAARPPALIDAIVRLAIPVPCREHVLGDLWERYRSPASYLFDAVRSVPFIVFSQIRRTSTVGAVLIQGFVLFVTFGAGAKSGTKGLLAMVTALLGLVLRDAYRASPSISARQIGVDLAVSVLFVAAAQAVVLMVAPTMLLPLGGLAGGTAAFVMIFFLRLQNPGLGAVPKRAFVQVPATAEALFAEIRLGERMTTRAARIEVGAGIVVAVAFVLPMLAATNWVLRAGWAFGSAYGLYVALIMWRRRVESLPEGLSEQRARTFYRRQLEAREATIRTMWRWYLLPGTPGVILTAIGSAIHQAELGKPAWPAAGILLPVLFVGLVIHRGSRDMANKVAERITALRAVEERQP